MQDQHCFGSATTASLAGGCGKICSVGGIGFWSEMPAGWTMISGLVLGFSEHVLVSCRFSEQINESGRCMIPTAGGTLT